ncbi:FAD-dependent oxidoreductase [Geminisphaera colitermitum]|uniref:FAD-dependent oxidoreductase n=1 Tax=Geminisphaera colitermitum TaxID=1148786 RepID=UPI0001964E58|nr:FAD-dependent oxidoreductase [Geminisphaera colitermitum]
MIDSNSHYDLVVIGGTPGGIACAVRAAREGLRVLLVNHTQHLGGFITSGAGGWETPCDYLRSPLYAEMITGAAEYYRDTYGENSPQHRAALPNPDNRFHIERPKVEPRVAEMLFEQMVAREKTLTVLKGYYVASAERDGAKLTAVSLKELHPESGAGVPPASSSEAGETPAPPHTLRITARTFADGTYEGDLAAAAGVPCQIGREPRSRYNEPHAGVIYSTERPHTPDQSRFPQDAVAGRLNIRSFPHATGPLRHPDSTGEGDSAVMAYNYRLILTKNPANRIPIQKPKNYDPDAHKKASNGSYVPSLPNVIADRPNVVPNIPNEKIGWNGGRLIGPHNAYPTADWPERERISRHYLDTMLSLLWFYQNDPAARECDRDYWKDYGLAADEFIDNQNVPYEIYVREARRLIGRYIFTEHDALPVPAFARIHAGARTPIHPDSVATTDWPIDSVACIERSSGPGAHPDGIFFLAEESRPAQVPYRTLLPQGLDNLLVPVALSASHVGWGPIRLEPVWMQTGEAAGLAAVLAQKHDTTPTALNPDQLLRGLVERHTMISFFNDVDPVSAEPWIPAVQYLGTKGFFATYDAYPHEPLTSATADCWAKAFAALLTCDTPDDASLAASAAHSLPANEPTKPSATATAIVASTLGEFASKLRTALSNNNLDTEPLEAARRALGLRCEEPLPRSAACQLIYETLGAIKTRKHT